MSSKTNHFTATVEVTQVTYTESSSHRPAEREREVSDVARLVLRADTLDGLRDKLASHVALIEN